MACAALRQAMPGLSFGALWFWASAAIAAEGQAGAARKAPEAVAVAEAAFQHALAYASERKQGRTNANVVRANPTAEYSSRSMLNKNFRI